MQTIFPKRKVKYCKLLGNKENEIIEPVNTMCQYNYR